jgi:hypothetical protein
VVGCPARRSHLPWASDAWGSARRRARSRGYGAVVVLLLLDADVLRRVGTVVLERSPSASGWSRALGAHEPRAPPR